MAEMSDEQRKEFDQLGVELDELSQRLAAIERRDFLTSIQFVSVDERIAIDAAHGIWKEDKAAWIKRRDAWQSKYDNRNQ